MGSSTTCWRCWAIRERSRREVEPALEVDGFDRRHLVVCGTEGTFHIQPLDNPAARGLAVASLRRVTERNAGLTFPKYVRLRG